MHRVPSALRAASSAVAAVVNGSSDEVFVDAIKSGVNDMVLRALQDISKLPRTDALLRIFYSPLVPNKVFNDKVEIVAEKFFDVLDVGISRLRQVPIPELARCGCSTMIMLEQVRQTSHDVVVR